MALEIRPNAIARDQGPFFFPGVYIGPGPYPASVSGLRIEGAGLAFVGAQSITTTTGDLTINPSGGVSFADNNITNVGEIDLDLIRADAANGSITVELDNAAGADFKVGNNSALVVEGDNDRVGLGTASPDNILHAISTLAFGEHFKLTTVEDINASAPSSFTGERARGSIGGETTVLDSDTLLRIRARGYDGSGYEDAAWIEMAVDGTPSDGTDMPGRIMFLTSADGSDSPTERMRIESGGNVGIGTTAPGLETAGITVGATTLTVFNSAGEGGGLELGSGTTTNSAVLGRMGFIADANAAGSKYAAGFDSLLDGGAGTNRGGNLRFFTKADGAAAGVRMVIDPSGNVGIGTTGPDVRLDVDGASIAVGTGANITPDSEIGRYSFFSRDTSTGASGERGYISLSDDSGFEWNGSAAREDTKMEFHVFLDRGDVHAMTIKSSGNVGIGTVSPFRKLQVHGSGDTRAAIVATGAADAVLEFSKNPDTGNTWGIGLDHSNSSALGIAYAAAGEPSLTGNNLVTILVGGNVGIGTDSPDAKLEIEGTVFPHLLLDGNATVANAADSWITNEGGFGLVLGSQEIAFITNAGASTTKQMTIKADGGIFFANLLAAAASTDVNINGSNELHSVTSSKRYKKFIKPLDKRFDSSLIYDLKPRSFVWKKNTGNPGMVDFGLVAEEAYDVLPEIVNLDADEKPYSIRTGLLPVLMLAEMIKLRARVEKLEAA